ncbi:uncharacterized protein LAESUDRAFT_699397 [Laetiporus sulphureus 93-53]|uniref:Rab-GAP TBC domain-containing protein n=1 Tax=Laetiporus sulphureus 93-53 TaxID=1314785 RepID=A0A165EGV5_9APHY|nr:uncharacterized protein LAESUDRAFT_699397 [Laetiporus sulphureus 93-53]KZT07026.1 hypothetical protein LAESUDRAFT_699397 [Laetiporus sulphureus 93-53]
MSRDGNSEAEQQQQQHSSIDWSSLRHRSLQPGGFGEERTQIWPQLLHVSATRSRSSSASSSRSRDPSEGTTAEGEDQNTTSEVVHQDERQIGLDTDRSFVLYPVEEMTRRERRQTQLHDLIVKVFRKRQRLHYFQGYHDIVSVIYLTLPVDVQVPAVEKLSLHILRDSMGTSLEPVVGLLRVLKRLLELIDADFSVLLERTSPLPYYALSNLLTLLSHDIPTLPQIQHVFDYLLCRHPIHIVYLVAALILARREEVRRLEVDGEEGMVHSVLSSLPELYEEAEVAPTVEEAITFQTQSTGITHSVSDTAPADAPNHDRPVETNGTEEVLSERYPVAEVDIPEHTPFGSEAEDSTAFDSSSSASSLTLDEEDRQPADTPADIVDGATTATDSRKYPPPHVHSPSSSLHTPPRPRVSITSLLMHADELYAQYPPSHPSVSLSSIMGPQSVMHTWSENPADLPDDDEAELMVDKLELVVLPYIEPEDEVPSDEEYVAERKKEAERRKRRKLRKPRRLVTQRKAMVAGAVLVMGIAMAVYGMQAGGPGGVFRGMADTQHHGHTLSKEWKRLNRFVGGVLLGVGERIVDGIWH